MKMNKYCCKGSALFTALALLVMAASIVTLLMTTQRVSIRRTDALLETDAAYYQSTYVESWAISTLSHWTQNKTSPYQWPIMLTEKAIPGGRVLGQIEDWQAKLNVNSLRLSLFQPYFVKVIRAYSPDIDKNTAKTLAENIRQKVLSTPTTVMLSELRTVDEMTATRFEALKPVISLLQSPNTTINLNAIDGKLLVALIDELSETDAQKFEQYRRSQGGIKTVKELATLFPDITLPESLFSIKSSYFLVTALVEKHDYQFKTRTLMRVSGNNVKPSVTIIWRSWS